MNLLDERFLHQDNKELIRKERNYNIDLIKIIACFAVVAIHTNSKDASSINAILFYLCGFAVPSFFMSSGYFLLNRGSISWKYSLNKLISLTRIILIWNLIVFVLKLVKQLLIDHEVTMNLLSFPEECVNSVLRNGLLFHFWYFGAFFILMIFLPFISRMRTGKYILMGITGTFATLLSFLSIIYGRPIQANVTLTFRIWTWTFYFILGSVIGTITDVITRKISIKLHILIATVVSFINIIYQCYAGLNLIHTYDGTRAAGELFYDDFLEMVWIVSLFSLFLRLNVSPKIKYVVEKVAPLTMGIYIIHPIIRKLPLKFIGNTSPIRFFICWISTLLGSALITWIITKTPLNKYLLKL